MKGISLKVKLISGFLAGTFIVIALSAFNVQTILEIRVSYSNLVESHLPRWEVLRDMRLSSIKIDTATSLYVIDEDNSAKHKAAILAEIDTLTGLETSYQTLLQNIPQSERQELDTQFNDISTAKQKTVDLMLDVITLKEQATPASALAVKQTALVESETALTHTLQVAIDHGKDLITRENAFSKQQVQQVSLLAAIGSMLAAAFAVVVGLAIAIPISRNIKKLNTGAARLTSGDFSSKITINSHDELGVLAKSFNQMSASLGASYRRLALEKERDETLLESMSEGMIALDEMGQVALINSVALTILGLDQQKAIGATFIDLVPLGSQDGKPLTTEDLPTATLATGAPVANVFSFQTASQHKILLSISSSPIKLDERIAGAIVILRDVTKEKEVDRMKTEFISLASHQLRTPLSAIKWFSEMLLNGDAGPLQPDQMEFTKSIADSTNRMVDLVNSLLNISRIESGRIIVDPKPTDLKELITGIVSDLKAKTEERQQTLVISVHSDLPQINLDPHLIGQVYLNLLTNAIKYTPKQGEISVIISKKGDDVISQVTDNGFGIPKAQQARVFQKFFRAENITKVETDGTGLGLYLIKAIVESSGGKIWFESEENKGTTFWFTIPLSGMQRKEGEVTLDA